MAAQWSIIIGALLPLLISVINGVKWSDQLKSVVALAVCVAAAAISLFIDGSLTGKDAVETIAIVYGTAMATYKGLWQPTGIADKIQSSILPRG